MLSHAKHSVSYKIRTACGIPRVIFKGAKKDWRDLREKVASLSRFRLEWWLDKLLPVIDKILAAVLEGEADPDFWNAACKIVSPGNSGRTRNINGWVLNFLPYMD